MNIMDPNANPIDFITVVQSVSMVFWSFSFVLFFCESGEMVTNQFNQFHEELCQFDWYLYPSEIQQLYLTFIMYTHRPAVIYGYGNILCTRDVFKMVMSLKYQPQKIYPFSFFIFFFIYRQSKPDFPTS